MVTPGGVDGEDGRVKDVGSRSGTRVLAICRPARRLLMGSKGGTCPSLIESEGLGVGGTSNAIINPV